jgi:hypothetical protein
VFLHQLSDVGIHFDWDVLSQAEGVLPGLGRCFINRIHFDYATTVEFNTFV